MTDRRRINEGYVIVCAVPVGNKEFVLGENRKAPAQFVTWQCKDGTDYVWGHYMDSPLKALKDLCGRVMEEVEYLEMREKEAAERNQPENKNAGRAEAGGRQKKPAEKQKGDMAREER